MTAQPTPSSSPVRLLSLIAIAGAGMGALESVYHRFDTAAATGFVTGGDVFIAMVAANAWLWTIPAALALPLVRRARPSRMMLWMWAAPLIPGIFLLVDHFTRRGPLWRVLWLEPTWILVVQEALLSTFAFVLLFVVLLRPFSRRWMASRRPQWQLGLGIIVLAASAGLGPIYLRVADRERVGDALPDAANVLLLTVDTLRQDALGAYGGPPTPAFDRILASGVRCQGFSPASWTRPAMAALFSGVGTTGNGGRPHRSLNPDTDWWPEHLASAGWITQAFITNPHLDRGFGFSRGFIGWDHADRLERLDAVGQALWVRALTRWMLPGQDRGDRVVDRARDWLNGRPDGPWLLWVHLLDPHLPYSVRGPQGQLRDDHPGAWLDPIRPYLENGSLRGPIEMREGVVGTTEAEREAIRRLYAREVQFVDAQLSRLWEAATEASGDREMLWVIASDHGEEFWEHGGFEHGHTLFDEVIRVPLAFGGADLPSGGAAAGGRLQDVGPTVLSLLRQPPMDPARGSGLSFEDSLGAWTLGIDLSASLIAPQPSCAPPKLLAEGMLYGPAESRWLWPDGVGYWQPGEREDDVLGLDVCGPGADTPLPIDTLPDELSGLIADWRRWRLEMHDAAPLMYVDPAIRSRIITLGYVH